MDCNNCATGITRFLERKGLQEVSVNFSTKDVRFRIGSQPVSIEEIEYGIQKLGYVVVKSEAPKPFWTLEKKLLFAAVFTAPLLLSHLVMALGVRWYWMHQPWVQFAFCLPVYVLGAGHFGRSALGALRSGVANMDVLILLGSTAAFVYSLVGAVKAVPDYIFFETAATIITLVLAGNWLEKRAVAQTTSAIKELTQLQAPKARKLMPSGAIVAVDKDDIAKGDILVVNEGDKIPADGKVMQGNAWVDESMLTGESEPVFKQQGDFVVGASLVQSGHLRLEVTATGRDSVLAQMIELVKSAQQHKPAIQRLADRISAVFVPAVVGIALLTFFVAYFVFDLDSGKALMNAIAVLVISCPCAMGLATPTAVMVGVGRLARAGVLVKGGDTVEAFARIRQMVFDKTGTLTTGALQVQRIQYFTPDKDLVHALVFQLEQHSSHPAARALMDDMLHRKNGLALNLHDFKEEKGIGVSAIDEAGNVFRLGSARILPAPAPDLEDSIFLTKNNQLLASFKLADETRADAAQSIASLKSLGVRLIILSGDKAAVTARLATELGIDQWHAEQLPEDKLHHIEQLSATAPTAMIGDGINDAPALSRATVGVSLSHGASAAMNAAQIVLLSGQLKRLPYALLIARHTVLTIQQNLFWAFAYNIVAIPLAALGFLNPMWGALFMAFSDVVVIGNSIRLRYKKIVA